MTCGGSSPTAGELIPAANMQLIALDYFNAGLDLVPQHRTGNLMRNVFSLVALRIIVRNNLDFLDLQRATISDAAFSTPARISRICRSKSNRIVALSLSPANSLTIRGPSRGTLPNLIDTSTHAGPVTCLAR